VLMHSKWWGQHTHHSSAMGLKHLRICLFMTLIHFEQPALDSRVDTQNEAWTGYNLSLSIFNTGKFTPVNWRTPRFFCIEALRPLKQPCKVFAWCKPAGMLWVKAWTRDLAHTQEHEVLAAIACHHGSRAS